MAPGASSKYAIKGHNVPGEQFSGWLSDEGRHKNIGWRIVENERCPHMFHTPFVHDGDLVGRDVDEIKRLGWFSSVGRSPQSSRTRERRCRKYPAT